MPIIRATGAPESTGSKARYKLPEGNYLCDGIAATAFLLVRYRDAALIRYPVCWSPSRAVA